MRIPLKMHSAHFPMRAISIRLALPALPFDVRTCVLSIRRCMCMSVQGCLCASADFCSHVCTHVSTHTSTGMTAYVIFFQHQRRIRCTRLCACPYMYHYLSMHIPIRTLVHIPIHTSIHMPMHRKLTGDQLATSLLMMFWTAPMLRMEVCTRMHMHSRSHV